MAHDDTTTGTETGSARAQALDVDQARATLHEMAAVVRTVFGVDLGAPLVAAEDLQQLVTEDPADGWTDTEEPTAAVSPTASPLTGDAHPVPHAAALTSVPVPSALPVEGIAVTPPGVATPMAASPLPASAHAAAQPGETAPATGHDPEPVPATSATPTTPPIAAPAVAPAPASATTPAAIPMPAVPMPAVPVPAAPVPAVPAVVHETPAPITSDTPDEPAEDTTPEGIPLPVGHAQTPDRRSMALLHEIAFLDD